MRFKNYFLLSVLAVLFMSCATPPQETPKYSELAVKENLIALLTKLERQIPSYYNDTGLASWYGPGFYGRKTASGTRFKKEALTCAHRTLPFGTKLKILNLGTGKSVEVLVNDRGPYITPRIVDLSYAAAREIGLLKSGVAKVEITELPQENRIARR